MAQQPDQTNPANSERMLAPHSGVQDIRTQGPDHIDVKVDAADAQRQASSGFSGN